MCLGVLGQGERYLVDSRFTSPSSTLQVFWQALHSGDAETASLCIEDGGYTGPYPGMVWFLPTSSAIRVDSIRTVPVLHDRVMASYMVHCFPLGVHEDLSFRAENQLVRVRGEWRICSPVGEVELPDWTPAIRKVSI